MRSKTIINSKGQRQATRIEIPIEGAGGELGQRAVINLTSLIAGVVSSLIPKNRLNPSKIKGFSPLGAFTPSFSLLVTNYFASKFVSSPG